MWYGYYDYEVNFKELVGKTISNVELVKDERSNIIERIYFFTACGKKYHMYHEQNCCEYVVVEDICGDIKDLIGSVVLRAEECESYDETPISSDSFIDGSNTWTFYHISTAKGTVTIRWHGSSNGYYSERVSFCDVTDLEAN